MAELVKRQNLQPKPEQVRKAVMDKLTEYKDATTYNNFYEFGTGKSDPASYAGTLKPRRPSSPPVSDTHWKTT